MGLRTALFSRHQSGGVFTIDDLAEHPGEIYFVDSTASGASDSAGYGNTPDKPFATLDYAVASCTADKGDVIYVMPGHNEGITAAAEIDLDVAGITVRGLGRGSNKPTIDFDHQDASFAIGASNVRIENFRFRVSANAVTVGLDIEAAAVETQIIGCEFGYAETSTDEFTIALRNNVGCDHTVIDGCFFDAGAEAAVTAISITGASDDVVIRNGRFIGAYSTACINGITTLSTNALIEGNSFYQEDTEPAVELYTGTTGIIRDNDVKTNLATMIVSIIADACFLFRNYYNEDVNPGTGTVMGTPSADG